MREVHRRILSFFQSRVEQVEVYGQQWSFSSSNFQEGRAG